MEGRAIERIDRSSKFISVKPADYIGIPLVPVPCAASRKHLHVDYFEQTADTAYPFPPSLLNLTTMQSVRVPLLKP